MSEMNKVFIVGILICALCATVSGQDMSECEVWTSVINSMQGINMLNPTCQHNPICTGFDCTGGYQHVSIGFGAVFYACNSPSQLRVYTSVLGLFVDRTINISSVPQTVDMPLYQNEAQSLINITVHVTVRLVGPRNISFQMSATVVMGSGTQFTPTVVPLVYIRVPECYLTRQHVTATTSTTLRTPAAALTQTGAVCQSGVAIFRNCGNNQRCSESDGHCYCIHEMIWDSASKQCVTKASTEGFPVTGTATSSEQPAAAVASGTGIIVIVVCILAAVLFAGIFTVIAIKYRRYRQRYGQHERLINNEGDDRDLEVDADPPMLQA